MSDQRELMLAEWIDKLPEPWRSKLGNMIEMNDALCGALAAAERERDEAVRLMKMAAENNYTADRELEEAESSLVWMRKVLDKYGRHYESCPARTEPTATCDCGYEAMLDLLTPAAQSDPPCQAP